MPCPDLGALRASIDAPDGPTPAPLHDHVQACASCADTLAELQRNAELAAPAIALTAPAEPPSAAAVEAALAPVLPAGPALVVALVSRLWMMLVEAAGAALAHLLVRRSLRGAGQDESARPGGGA